MKIYDITLECGCMIAPDTGTPRHQDGNAGLLPCYAEYGDMSKEEILPISLMLFTYVNILIWTRENEVN